MLLLREIMRSPFSGLRSVLMRDGGCLLLPLVLLMILWGSQAFAQGDEKAESEEKKDTPASSSSTINFDGRMLAGLNGDSMFALSMTQGLTDFAYQLNSSVVYTNDFEEYSNSSFITNETGFTGELGFGELWKLIPQFEIANSTYGMFDNPYYTRENKDRINLRLKTEYRPSPARWVFDFTGARYDHNLKIINVADVESETFYLGRGIISMEYIWSDANKAGFILEGAWYNYPDEFGNDAYTNGEFYGSFKITEYIMLTITPIVAWNRDATNYIYFKGNISSINLKYLSLELFHEYKLVPYRPEELLAEQKYVLFGLDLPPSTVNHSEFKGDFDLDFSSASDSTFSVSALNFKFSGVFENSSDFYNYVTTPENVLGADAIQVKVINGNADFVTSFIIVGLKFSVDLAYSYFRYYAPGDTRITYRPENIFTFNLSLDGSWLEINWGNSYNGNVFTDPESDERLDPVISGTLDIHLKVYDTFYIDSRINNLYNAEYSYREGYPEPGVQFFIGLRVMI